MELVKDENGLLGIPGQMHQRTGDEPSLSERINDAIDRLPIKERQTLRQGVASVIRDVYEELK